MQHLRIIKIHSKIIKIMRILSFISTSFLLMSLFVFTSCNNEDITEVTAIQLKSIGGTELLINQEFQFEVIGNNSQTLTSDATIKVDGVTLENNLFTSATPNSFKVQAFYKGFESEVLDIAAVYPSGYIKNVLIEDYTGTWCSNCPRVAWAIELAKEQSDKIVPVTIHAYDEMEMPGYEVLTDAFIEEHPTPFPSVRLNRINKWADDVNNIDAALNFTGYGADLGLAIESSRTNSTIQATVKIGFENTITKPLKLVVYLTENGLLYNQVNSTDFFGGAHILVDFEHNNVLRAFYTDYLGETIPNSETIADHIYEFSINKVIPTIVINNNKLHLVAFVTDASTNEVINVREVKIGEEQELQEL